MSRKTKVFIAILLSFCFCFVGIGYASVSVTLDFRGDAEAVPQKGVFISLAQGLNGTNTKVNSYISTVLNSTTTLQNSSSTVTYDITLYNNSNYVYVFNGEKYLDTAYDNTNITYTITGLKKGDEIKANSYLTFSVTFKYKNGANTQNKVLNSVINYEFVPAEEYIPEIAVSGALEQFEIILNSSGYDTLTNQMGKTALNGGNRPSDSYIGNVVGSSSADTSTLNQLFTVDGDNKLKLVINGETTNVTAMIKREKIDGDNSTGDGSGNEFTIYMTAYDFEGTKWGQKISVYAAVFTKDSSGKWYQLGPMYEGQATVNNYDGILGLFGDRNSFNTGTWESTKAYNGLRSGADLAELTKAYKNLNS